MLIGFSQEFFCFVYSQDFGEAGLIIADRTASGKKDIGIFPVNNMENLIAVGFFHGIAEDIQGKPAAQVFRDSGGLVADLRLKTALHNTIKIIILKYFINYIKNNKNININSIFFEKI